MNATRKSATKKEKNQVAVTKTEENIGHQGNKRKVPNKEAVGGILGKKE